MKKIVLVIIGLAILWVGIQYVRTGELTLFPAALSEEEQQVRDLEHELNAVKSQIAQAGRAAGMTGMDMTADVDALMKRKEALEKQIEAARKKLQ